MHLPWGTAETIQVKANNRAGRSGRKGKRSLGYRFDHFGTTHWLACVDLSTDSPWLFTHG